MNNYPTQILTLNWDGKILNSDDGIFNHRELPDNNALKEFLFLQSIYAQLKELPENKKITFPVIANNSPWLYGYFDYIFEKLKHNGQIIIQWTIINKTAHYQNKKIEMQKLNDEQISIENKSQQSDKDNQRTD